jgi:hypothetical protein
MAYTAIDDPSAHFQIALYTGDSSSVTVTNDGNSDLQPDWLWIKRRNGTNDHNIFDSSRAFTQRLWTNQNTAENAGDGTGVTVHSDGFATGTYWGDVNSDGNTFVGWQWKANGGTRTTNTESGNNPAGGYQANTAAGFSIVDYIGTGSAGTMAHGLGAVPDTIWVQNREESEDWAIYHKNASSAGNDSYLRLNTTAAAATAGTVWNDTTPTSSVFTIGSNNKTNKDGVKYIAYCFTSIQGYSKFGGYTGNNSADGMFIYCGFKPKWVMIKNIGASEDWYVYDIARATTNGNQVDIAIQANSTGEFNTSADLDFLSNGFKCRGDSGVINDTGSFVYFAIAETPFVSSEGVPCTAR